MPLIKTDNYDKKIEATLQFLVHCRNLEEFSSNKDSYNTCYQKIFYGKVLFKCT